MTYYGIYRITNLLNGKMYIGQHTTTNIDDGYMGSGIWIQRAIKKYGKENFRKEWLMFCEDEEELNWWERAFVDQNWVDRSDTYNIALGGGANGINFRKCLSPETRKKLSITRTGQPLSAECKEKLSKRFKGKNHPMYGRKQTEESKQKNRESQLGEKGNAFGKHWWNNGEITIYSKTQPEGFVAGRLSLKKKEGSR